MRNSCYKRKEFKELLETLEEYHLKGIEVGILTWALSRLSRNPIESAQIQWMLQQGVIKAIRTIDRVYLPDDNALLMNVEAGMANQFILELKKNTQRGINSKYEKGWKPNMAPIGYLNVGDIKGEKTIEPDLIRFDLVKKMWDMMLTGAYTPPQILEIATNEWQLTTVKRRKIGGKPLSNSGIYRMFTNMFYAGIIQKKNGTQYVGMHKAMITLEEFDKVQYLLGREGKPRFIKHEHSFTGVIHCAECGCLYTAETKQKLIKATGEVKTFSYYHCT